MRNGIVINQNALLESGLNLDVVDLIIFDFLYSLSGSKRGISGQIANLKDIYFRMSPNMIMAELPVLGLNTKKSVMYHIKRLEENKVIEKSNTEYYEDFYRFGENACKLLFDDNKMEVVKDLSGDSKESKFETQKTANAVQTTLFCSESGQINGKSDDKAKKTNFENSGIEELINYENQNYDCLIEKLSTPAFSTALQAANIKMSSISYIYYINAVKNWSEAKNKTSTFTGWLAMIRNFILSDLQRNKVVIIQSDKPRTYLTTEEQFQLQQYMKNNNL